MAYSISDSVSIQTDKTFLTGYQDGPAKVVALKFGGFMILQQHSAHVHTELFTSAGTSLGTKHFIDFNIQKTIDDITQLSNQDIVYVTGDVDSIGFTISSLNGSTITKITTDIGDTLSFSAKVTALPGGGFVIAYQDIDFGSTTGYDIKAKIYTNSGVLLKSIDIATTNLNEEAPTIAQLGGSGFVVAWENSASAGSWGGASMSYAIYNTDGTVRVAAQTLASTGSLVARPAIESLSDGGFIMVYVSEDEWTPGHTGITIAKFDFFGNLVSKNDISTAAFEYVAASPKITVLDNGNYAITTHAYSPGDLSPFVEIILVDSNNGLVLGTTNSSAAVSALINPDIDVLADGTLVSAVQVYPDNQVQVSILSLESGARTWISDDNGDIMVGNDLVDIMFGFGGADTLIGGAGDDDMRGGAGDDIYHVDSSGDTVTELDGQGIDTVLSDINYTLGSFLENLELATFAKTGTGNELDNKIVGNSLINTIWGEAGNDKIFGLDGADWLLGGVGDDLLKGGNGKDTLEGEEGDDKLEGGKGGDLIQGGIGDDKIFGGNGYDTLHGGDGNDRVWGGDGIDTVYLGDGHDTFFDTAQNGKHGGDIVFAGGGKDTINIGGGNNILTGGAGADTFHFNSSIARGESRITDFVQGKDVLEMSGVTYSDLKFSATGSGVRIEWDEGSVKLDNVSISVLSEDDFLFV